MRVTAPIGIESRVLPHQLAAPRAWALMQRSYRTVRWPDPRLNGVGEVGDVAEGAVSMLVVVATHEFSCSGPNGLEVGEAQICSLRARPR